MGLTCCCESGPKVPETVAELEKNKNVMKKFTLDGEVHLATVIRCYDGDTLFCRFKYNGEYKIFTIRMAGYDSPEIKLKKNMLDENGQLLSDKQKEIIHKNALAAKAKLEELTLNKNVYVYCQDFDKFRGRIDATIKQHYNDKKTVNELMIEGGFGLPYNGGTKDVLNGLEIKTPKKQKNKKTQAKTKTKKLTITV